MLKRFISYYGPHKKLFFLDMLASLLVSVIGLLYPMITRRMMNEWIPEKNLSMLVTFGIVLFKIVYNYIAI